MLSEMFLKLWNNGILQRGIWETVYMTVLSTAISYVIGLPLGVVLTVTDKGGLHPIPWLNRLLGIFVNFFRSIPFIILMVAMLPVANWIVGTSLGNKAMIVMLVIAASPYIARMVESSVKEVDGGVIEAAQSMGASNFEIVCKVLLPEAKPSLIMGAVISMVTIDDRRHGSGSDRDQLRPSALQSRHQVDLCISDCNNRPDYSGAGDRHCAPQR